jgi:hypothetical protein
MTPRTQPRKTSKPTPDQGVSIGVMPVPNGVHLQIHESDTNHVIDFVLNSENAMGFAVALMHAVQIAESADPPTFN